MSQFLPCDLQVGRVWLICPMGKHNTLVVQKAVMYQTLLPPRVGYQYNQSFVCLFISK